MSYPGVKEDRSFNPLVDGIVCMTGYVGNKWWLDNFAPMDAIPMAIYLTAYE